MSTNTNIVVPKHIMDRMAARQQGAASSGIAAAIVSGDGFGFPKISIRAGRYRLIEDGVETPVGINLDAIIVGANPRVSKIFYSKAYDGSDGVRPDCLSHDGLKPDAGVENPVSTSCLTCPHNVLGSKITPNGAQSKMCADQRHLAVVPAADPTKVYAMTVPVSGMKALREYFKELQNFGAEPNEVVTELGFDDKASFPKITFARKGFVPEKALPKIDAIVASDTVKEVVRMIPPQPKGPALAAPAAQPAIAAPAVDEDYEEVLVIPTPPVSPTEFPKPTKAAKPAPAVETVKSSSELENKLDSLFAE